MNDQSKTSYPANFEATSNAISSPASESGPMPCAKPDGPMTEKSGPEVAPANLSARQAKEKGLLTSGTYGPRFITSSGSVRLETSLVNRLRQKTALLGSRLFQLTWKQRDTPLGVSISVLRASVRRTSGKDCTSSEAPWITPQTHDTTVRGNVNADHHYSPHDLSNQALLASGWPTPSTALGGKSERTVGGAKKEAERKGWNNDLCTAALGTWPTPTSLSPAKNGNNEAGNSCGLVKMKELVSGVAWLTDSGEKLSGSTAETKSSGQLNPALPRWLQGLPIAWESCADMVTHSVRRSRKVSSKPI